MRSRPFVLVFSSFILFAAIYGIQQQLIKTPSIDRTVPVQLPGSVPGNGDYWAIRYTYPTFQFDQRWLNAAKLDHERMLVANPKGIRMSAERGANTLPTEQFTLLGPRPLGSGATANAGRTNVVISDPVDPSIAYIGSDGGGVWKTTNCCDANTTWTVMTDDPQFNSIAIGTMHMDPHDHNTLYAGTGDLRYGSFTFGSAGLLRSRDAGENWEVLGADVFGPALPQAPNVFPQYQAIGQVQVDPRDAQTLIVGTKTGLFISYDDGSNWTGPCLTNTFASQRQDITSLLTFDNGSATELMVAVGTRGGPTGVQPDLDQNGANGIYAGTLPASGCPSDFQLISRADNGWPAGTGAGTANGPLGRLELARAPTNSDIIYAEAVSPTSLDFLGVWRSNDGGANWTQTANAADLSGCTIGAQSWYYAGILVSPNDSEQFFMNGLNKFRSVNGGDTLQGATCNDSIHVDHHATAYVNNDPARLLVGSDGGIYYTANANAANVNDITYIQLNNTLPTLELYSGDITADFAFAANRGAATGAQDNGSSVVTWNGPVVATNWTRVFGGDGIYARIEPVLGQRWYVESQNGNIAVSQGGPNGNYQTFGRPWSADTLSFLFPFEIYKHDCSPTTGCQHLIAGSNRVWESITGGLSSGAWYANSPNLSKGVLGDRSFINQLDFAFTDESIVIAGTNDGNVWFGFNMGQGTANSGSWVDVTDSNTVLPNRPILDVIIDGVDSHLGYAAVGGFNENTPSTPGHVFQVQCNSDCSSLSWSDKSGNLPNIPVNAIMVNPHNPAQVFAGSDWGMYFTDDIDAASPVWMRFTAGLPTASIWDMVVDRGQTTLAVFTRSRGAFAWPLPLGPDEILQDGFENLVNP